MEYEMVELQEFYIAGISVRTRNEGGQAEKDIGMLWQRFYTENIGEQIRGKLSENLYNLYTDYEEGHHGFYTTLLGYKLASDEALPGGLTVKKIPAATYRVYTSKGKLPDAVIGTWRHIWGTEIPRAYLADFDLYLVADSDNAKVKTYLSVVK